MEHDKSVYKRYLLDIVRDRNKKTRAMWQCWHNKSYYSSIRDWNLLSNITRKLGHNIEKTLTLQHTQIIKIDLNIK